MNPIERILAGLALLLLVAPAAAENRSVLIQLKQDKDRKVSVAIHSDEKKEQKSDAAVDEAVKIIGEMKGWGSSVSVYVASDRGIKGADLKKVLAAITDNYILDLAYFGRDVPKVIGDHFLKRGLDPVATPPAVAVAETPALKVPKEVLQKRLEAARKVFQENQVRIRNREGLPSELFGWSERWLDAELAICDKESERVKALRDHLDRLRDVERLTLAFARTGQGRQADADAATYYRLEAEIRLFKEGVEPHAAKESKEQREKP